MSTEDNLATIRGIYEAFGTGDVETILAGVADDVDWAVDAEPVGPWYGQRKGKDGVATFFADIAGAADVLDFGVEGMGASVNEVFALVPVIVQRPATCTPSETTRSGTKRRSGNARRKNRDDRPVRAAADRTAWARNTSCPVIVTGRPVRRGLASGGPARHAHATRAAAATNTHANGRPPQRMAFSNAPNVDSRRRRSRY